MSQDIRHLYSVPTPPRMVRNPIGVAWAHVIDGIDAGLGVPHLPADDAAVLHRMRRGAAMLAGERPRPRGVDHESEA